jgi:hypothetical protein
MQVFRIRTNGYIGMPPAGSHGVRPLTSRKEKARGIGNAAGEVSWLETGRRHGERPRISMTDLS